VGSREGVGGGALRSCRGWAFAAAKALAAEVVFVVASRGILFGPWRDDLIGDAGAAVPDILMTVAVAVDLVTREGRCSDAVTPLVGTVLTLRTGGATPKAGSTSSSSSSSSESWAARLAFGVLRG